MGNYKKLVLLIIILLLGVGSGLALNLWVQWQKKYLPVPVDLLINPIIHSLSANIEGKVIEKTDEYFILEKAGKRVKIYFDQQGASSFIEESSKERVSYTTVEVGDYLQGGVTIVIKISENEQPNRNRKLGDVIGNNFAVIRKLKP